MIMFMLPALLLCTLAAPPANDLTLWYTRPASEWNEALPVRNALSTSTCLATPRASRPTSRWPTCG